jgi:two-component system sensor histidine kinase YesM
VLSPKYSNLFYSIAVQLFIIFVLSMTMPILIGGYLSYQKSAKLIEQEVSNVASLTISQVKDKLDFIYKDAEDTSMMILYNTKIQEALEGNPDWSIYEQRQKTNEAREIISSIMSNSKEILDIYIVDVDGENAIYSSINETTVNSRNTSWYEQIVEADGRPVWFGFNKNSYLKESNLGMPVYALGRTVKNVNEDKIIGVMMIEIRGDFLARELAQVKFGQEGYTFIVDDTNSYVYHPDAAMYSKISEYTIPLTMAETDQQGTERVVIPAGLNNGWRVVGIVSVEDLVQGSIPIRNLTIIISSLSILWALVIGFYISHRIGRPLRSLNKLMEKGETGDLSIRSNFSNRNEIGQLSKSFNRMIEKIDQLFHRISEEESEKKKAEIRALRYQINPHFMFNTLNSIRWMAKLNKTEEVSNAITLFVFLLEGTIERNGMFIKLEQEFDMLKKYVALQQYRYTHQINLQIECSATLKDIEIPRMLLQPLVENAIFHGLAPKEQDGTIHLLFKDCGDDVSVTINDDGIGIAVDKLSTMHFDEADHTRSMTRIGLHHVHQILKLYYGERYGVEINSSEGKGTTIHLTFSKQRGVKAL